MTGKWTPQYSHFFLEHVINWQDENFTIPTSSLYICDWKNRRNGTSQTKENTKKKSYCYFWSEISKRRLKTRQIASHRAAWDKLSKTCKPRLRRAIKDLFLFKKRRFFCENKFYICNIFKNLKRYFCNPLYKILTTPQHPQYTSTDHLYYGITLQIKRRHYLKQNRSRSFKRVDENVGKARKKLKTENVILIYNGANQKRNIDSKKLFQIVVGGRRRVVATCALRAEAGESPALRGAR